MAITLDRLDTIIVTATDFDIRDLVFATDKVDVSGSSVTVTATDLDIRDLVNTQDSVAIGDETNIVDMQQMDSAFGITSQGFPIFGVRSDAGGSPVSADGDSHPLLFNDNGELYVAASVDGNVADDAADSGNPLKVGGRALTTASALSALSASGDRGDIILDLYRRVMTRDAYDVAWQTSVAVIGATAAEVAATPLAGRKTVFIQNVATNSVWVGTSNAVTTATGIEIPKNASMEINLGEALNVFAIAAGAGNGIRVYEAA